MVEAIGKQMSRHAQAIEQSATLAVSYDGFRIGRRTESLLSDDIDFAVEGVAEIVGDFGHVTVEKQVTEFPEAAGGVGNAHAPLPAIPGLIVRASIHCRQHLPAATARIDVGIRPLVEGCRGAIANPNAVNL